MSIVAPPNAREVQEFQFKLLSRLRFFGENEAPPLKQPLNLVVAISKFGLVCVGTSNGFDVVETAKIVEQFAGAKKPTAEVTNFPRRRIVLGVQPSHLDVSCDSQYLAVGFATAGGNAIRVYNVTSFMAQSEQVVSEVRVPAPLQALSWNPGIPNLLATCLQDCSASVYEFKNNSFDISSIPPDSQSTCLCWSPKGKQIVIGSKNGSINQFKPDLKIVKTIPPPNSGNSVVSVQWLSSIQYAAVYCGNGMGPNLVLVNTPKGQPITYTNYEDITYSNGNNRVVEFYFIHQQTWNVLLVGSSNSMEVGVLGMQGSDWEQWTQEDAARAELPLSATKKDTHPIGMALDTSVQHTLPWGDNQQLPPMPLLLLLSHEGLLSLYWSLNLLQGAVSICAPPTPLPDTSGLHLFTVPTQPSVMSPAQPKVEINPPPPAAPPSAQPPAVSVAPLPVWGQAAPVTPPKTTTGTTQASWMMSSSSPNTFISSVMQPPTTPSTAAPAFITTAFSPVSSAVPVSAFSISSSTASTPFSFIPQTVDLASKQGAFVAPALPINASPQTPTPLTAAPVSNIPDKVDIPAVPILAPSPATVEPEISEESQELNAMNEAVMEDAIREEITHFSQEINQMRQRYQNRNMNVINVAALEKLSEDIDNWSVFVREVVDTTKVQRSEVNSLRNFLLDVFTYVENMKTRLHLQNNPDYLSLQSPDMKDPVLSRKVKEVKTNSQFIESQLISIDRQLSDKWRKFQESNKENRESMQIPSLEAIYQAMVMHNNVLMKQRSIVDDIENKVKVCQQRKLMSMLNISRMVDSQTENQESEFSSMLQDLVSLSVNSSKINTSTLEDSLTNLTMCDSSLSNLNNIEGERCSSRMALLQQLFTDNTLKYLDNSLKMSSPQQNSVLPIVSVNPCSGSISSGHPVVQSSTPKTLLKNTIEKPTMNQKPMLNEITKPPVQLKHKSPFSIPTPSGSSPNFSMGTEKSPNNDSSKLSLGNTSKMQPLHLKNDSSLNTNIAKTGIVMKTTSTSPSTNPIFNFSSTNISTSAGSNVFGAVNSNASKGFLFAPLSSNQTAFSPPSFGSNNAQSSSSSNAAFGSVFGFCSSTTTVTSTVTSIINTSSFTTEVSKSSTSSNLLSNITPAEIIPNNVPTTKLPVNSNPLASLSSLVSGIEPLKHDNSQINFPNQVVQASIGNATDVTPSQTSLLKVTNEIKTTSDKEQAVLTQKPQTVFGSSVQIKPEIKEPQKSATNVEKEIGEMKNTLGGSFKKLTFDSTPVKSIFGGSVVSEPDKQEQTPPVKSIFGGSTQLTPLETETGKQEQTPQNVFTFSTPSSSNLFVAGNETFSSQTPVFSTNTPSSPLFQKEQPRKTEDSSSENTSKIIEISLSTSTSELDSKASLEKLSTKKDLVITKVESLDKKSPTVDAAKPKEAVTNTSLFSSLSSFQTTPARSSQTIFGGSSPEQSLPTYEVKQSEAQSGLATDLKAEDLSKLQEKSNSQGTQGSSSENNKPQLESNKLNQSSTFSFGSNILAVTTAPLNPPNSASAQVTSSFSFSQLGTQASSTGFSFSIPSTSAPTTSSSAFSFGSLSSGSTDEKSKSGFSFGQVQTPASSTGNIFGGSSNKPVVTSSVFGGQSTTVETKSIFNPTPTTNVATTETKSVFGQPQTTIAETNVFFGQTPAPPENKNVFAQSSINSAENKNIFGQPPTTSAETKIIFGQTSTNIVGGTNIFGGTSTASTDGKSVFGQTTSPAENKNVFGQAPATITEGKGIFGQASSETKSIFGQTTPATTDGKSPFGQPTSTESKSMFGQTPATTSDLQSAFSFSLGISTTSAQTSFFGSPATTAATFFGQPVCSPVSTANSPFGQSTSTSGFGSGTQSPFGSTSTFGSKPTFGQSGGSFFGQSSGGFGSNSGSVFGGGSTLFGGNSSQPNSTFGSTQGGSGDSMFGGGSFSAGGQSVAQTGFGTSGFQNKPAFGTTSPPSFGAPPAFGGAPTFGGSASFGSPPKLFGSPSSGPSAFGSSPQQQSSTFESLANQNTMTFGNLAQSQTSAFGSVFSQPQASSPTPAFPPATSGSVFGGSSFSSWR